MLVNFIASTDYQKLW